MRNDNERKAICIHTFQDFNGQWKNARANANRASSVHATKTEAVARGRELAKNSRAEHVIHLANGRIQNSNSYGNDPCPPKDKK